MADLKISALPASTVPLAGTEVLPIVQSSATKQVTVANLTAGRAVATGALTVTGDATLSTGNLVIGTAGKGIDFSATPGTGSSELLNDYEEGSWTPSVYDALTGGNKSATNGGGSYTKIGQQVTVRFNVDDINTAGLTAGNAACIGDLPFTAGTSAQGSFYTYRVGGGTAQAAFMTVTPAATRMRIALFYGVSVTTDVNITVGDLVTGVSAIYGTITYFV